MLNHFNFWLFSLINAQPHTSYWLIDIALFYSDFLLPIFIILIFIFNFKNKPLHILLISTCTLALGLNYIFNQLFYFPRPFVLHIGQTLIHHAATSSLPSHHMLIASVVCICLFIKRLKKWGYIGICIALAVGWSRIFIGVHFPLDIISAVLFAYFYSISILFFIKRLKFG